LYIEKIGLRGFLYDTKVLGIDSLACRYGFFREISQHVIIGCPLQGIVLLRKTLFKQSGMDYDWLLSSAKSARRLASWWLKERVLEQFWLANELIR
jgi:hypothetical protein